MKTIIGFLIIFSVIVIIHELGHFIWARRAGILVREFSVGMGPKIFSQQDQSGTTYTMRMLPMGGYVRLAGMGEEDESVEPGMEVGLRVDDTQRVVQINTSDRHDVQEIPLRVDQVDLKTAMEITGYVAGEEALQSFAIDRQAKIIEPDGTLLSVAPEEVTYEAASPWNKFKMNVAGPMHNFILSIVAFAVIGFLLPGIPKYDNSIGEIQAESSAAQAGLQEGDIVQAIDGESVTNWHEMVAIIQAHPDEELEFVIVRDDAIIHQPVHVAAVQDPQSQEEFGQIGVLTPFETSFQSRMLYGFTETWGIVMAIFATLAGMFKHGFDLNSFGGPVAMAQMTGEAVNSGLTTTLWLMGMLSANLGVLNLLPVPALDGGKIVLNVVEGIRGKGLSEETEGMLNIIGFFLLIGFMLLVTWNDLSRLFN